MDEILRVSLAERRFNMFLLGLFTGLPMILAAVGLYGVISYTVSHRTHRLSLLPAIL